MGTLIQVSDTVRVERGLARKRGKATKALLSDRATAGHYKPGKRDAAGRTIVAGREMEYLDFRGARVWYVYAWRYCRTRMLTYQVGPDGVERLVETPDEGAAIRWGEVDGEAVMLDADGNPTEDVEAALRTEDVWCYQVADVKPTRDEALAVARELAEA